MVRLVINKEGNQLLTEICDTCKCHIKDLSIEDITIKARDGLTIKGRDGIEITNTDPRPKCYCDDCCD